MKRQKRINRRKAHARKRNYKEEYRRRIAKGLASGKSRPQSRGHPRPSEVPKSPIPSLIDPNAPLERALRRVKAGESIKEAAKKENVPRERLRLYIAEHVEAHRKGRRWEILDNRPVEMAMCSRGKLIWVNIFRDQTSPIGEYWNGLNRFLRSNDPSHLEPFKGKGVRDIAGKYYSFEVRPNTLRRLASAGELNFLAIYKDVAPAGSTRHG
jgi:hypothetical protein